MPRIELNNAELMDIISQRLSSTNDDATALTESFGLDAMPATAAISDLIEKIDNVQALLGELKEAIHRIEDKT